MRAQVLFVTWDGGGNINPMLALAVQLRNRGHVPRVLSQPGDLGDRFRREGVLFRLHRSDADGRPTHLAEDVLKEIHREPTDVVVVDYMQPEALSAAESTALPVVAFVHTLYSSVVRGPRTPMGMAASVEQINELRGSLGLPAVQRLTDLLDRAACVLVTTTRELDAPETGVPPNVRYVGPLVEAPGNNAGWSPPWQTNDAPLVLVCLGTTDMGERPVLERLIEALAEQPGSPERGASAREVRVLVTVGKHIDPASFDVPGNIVVTGYVRHAAVLPHARAMVTHAGLSGVGAALKFGVPMVCVPLGREQPDNAAQVQKVGAGVTLSSKATAAEMRAAVMNVLRDDRYRAAAQRAATSIAAANGAEVAVDTIESLTSQ